MLANLFTHQIGGGYSMKSTHSDISVVSLECSCLEEAIGAADAEEPVHGFLGIFPSNKSSHLHAGGVFRDEVLADYGFGRDGSRFLDEKRTASLDAHCSVSHGELISRHAAPGATANCHASCFTKLYSVI